MMSTHQVTIYDTTLRDGTQGEGISFSLLDKLRIAEKLDSFGMHYIEGGWPGSNPKDLGFFKEAAKKKWRHAKITAFGSTRRANTPVAEDAQVQLLLDADTPAVTIFGKSWKLHVTDVLGTTPEENRAMIRDTVAFLKENGKETLYDAEHFFDGFKDDQDHAMGTVRAAAEAGADIVVLCDTNGGTLPHEVEEITRLVGKELGIPIGIHTHNDCGLGVANALAAVRAGAIQIQGTMNGYGERVGNCNLTSVIPNLQLKMDCPVVGDLSRLRELSLFVDDLANLSHDIRAPFVGTAAFAHKGGMHVNAVQKVAHSYEHIRPEEVGNAQHILVSELSGQSNVLMKAAEIGYQLEKNSPEVREVLMEVKRLESQGYEFEAAEASFELLLRRILKLDQPPFEVLEYHCSFRRLGTGLYENCEATVKLNIGGRQSYTVANGDGPVNALDGALRKALGEVHPTIDQLGLLDYKVRIIDGKLGTAAKTRVLIMSSDEDHTWGTVGVSYNIIEASWLALKDSFEYKILKDAQAVKPARQ